MNLPITFPTSVVVTQSQFGVYGLDQYKNGWCLDTYPNTYPSHISGPYTGILVKNNCNATATCHLIVIGY